MMSTYTLTDFRLPRPAGAGLAMTLLLHVSYKAVNNRNVHNDVIEL